MGKVIEFNNDINKTNNEIRYIFKRSLVELEKIKNHYDEIDPIDLKNTNYLEEYINNLLLKTKDRNWKTNKTEERFINLFNIYLNTFMEYYDDSDEYEINEKYGFELFVGRLIYFTDLDSTILNEEEDYLELIVTSFDFDEEYMNISDKNKIKKVLNYLKRNMIKNLFEEIDETDINVMKNIIFEIHSGKDPYTISKIYELEEIEDNLEEGDLTKERISEYYLNQEESRFSVVFDKNKDYIEQNRDHDIRMAIISSIKNIKFGNKEYEKMFYEIVRNIVLKHDVDEELRCIIRLTTLLYEQGNQITEFDKEDIEHYINLGGKHENRRL